MKFLNPDECFGIQLYNPDNCKINLIACRIIIQVIYNAIVAGNIRNSSFLIQAVYDFDTVCNTKGIWRCRAGWDKSHFYSHALEPHPNTSPMEREIIYL